MASVGFASPQCKEWFDKAKIKAGKSCVLDCAMKAGDFESFSCSDECDSLCDLDDSDQFLFDLAGLYPGLTDAERALAATESVKTLKAYKLSWQAESQCNKIFGSSRHNDESDACRHFVWAAILSHDLGEEFAKRVLAAHEADPDQPKKELEMDVHNNSVGLAAAKRLGEFDESSLMREFKRELSEHKLTVMSPRKSEAKK